jgi:Cu(I)/Ag(I) efflux system membrane fusion protein
MKKINVMLIGVLLLLATIGGYWWGSQRADDRGMKMAVQPARKILYYRNPMGLQDTSPVAKKDVMGMDYVPVYEGGDDASIATTGAGQVRISVEKVQKLGVKTEQAKMRVLDKTVRASGRVEADERHIYSITPKFEGWIEKLYVNTTGESVSKGQPLFDVYSPELISAQREYAIAAQGVASLKDADNKRSMQQLADASLLRLKNWDISGQQVQGLAKSEATRRNLTFDAPVNGIVLVKKAVQGMRFMPGETLYQIADLSVVWVVADVFEQDIGLVQVGSKAQIKLDAYPDKRIEGVVSFVYPTLNAATRTVPVRLEMANPKGLLKPAMFAQVEIPAISKGEVLTVPTSAVIDSGTRQIVLVQLAEGRFEPRTVRLGSRSEDYVEVLSGVAEGEQVVVAANFLIDAESNLKAALGDFGHAEGGAASATKGSEQPAASVATPVKNKTAGVGHQGLGILNRVNEDGTVSITFEAIKTLSMPGMTMDFQLANSSLVAGIKPGSAISFELVERKPDEWLITRLQASRQHEGH